MMMWKTRDRLPHLSQIHKGIHLEKHRISKENSHTPQKSKPLVVYHSMKWAVLTGYKKTYQLIPKQSRKHFHYHNRTTITLD